MEVILSAAVSIDGYLDDCAPDRLLLSDKEDMDAVRRLRATCDAILVGAGTIRRDDPALVIRDEQMRRGRIAAGLDADMVKVTITASGEIDPEARFFSEGAGHKIVFASGHAPAPASASAKLDALAARAELIVAERVTARFIVETLEARGYRRLMVEGGSSVHTMFLEEGMTDRLRLAVAPFFVGGGNAPRLVENAVFPHGKNNRATLEAVEMVGQTAVMHFKMKRT